MAGGDEPVTDRRILAGIVSLAAIAVLIGGAFAGLLVEGLRDLSGAFAAFDAYLVRIAWFTLWQAALSTVLSVVPAIFVARALSRHPSFPGRAIILRLFALPLALPAIVAALGILALLGRAGYLASRCRRCQAGPGPASTAFPAFWSRMSSSTCRWRRGFSSKRSTRCRPINGGWLASSAWGRPRPSG